MYKEWIPVIAALLGVIVGGAVTSFIKWFELRHQIKLEERKLMLTKLEELHREISSISSSFQNYNAQVFKIILGDEIAGIEQRMTDVANSLIKIGTLLYIYAPDLKTKWHELNVAFFEMNKIFVHQIGRNSLTIEQTKPMIEHLFNLCGDIQSQIQKKTRKYTGVVDDLPDITASLNSSPAPPASKSQKFEG
jgi:Na+/phosphate symporter